MTFQTEFPDFPAADMPVMPATFVDASWHNDACPCIQSDALGVHIFINYSNPDLREFRDAPRFCAVEGIDGPDMGMLLAETDDWGDVLALIAKRAEG